MGWMFIGVICVFVTINVLLVIKESTHQLYLVGVYCHRYIKRAYFEDPRRKVRPGLHLIHKTKKDRKLLR